MPAALPITGKNVKVELLVDGVPQKIIDQVIDFSEEERAQTVETQHLGTDDVQIRKLPMGWGGQITLSRKSGQIDDFIDAYDLALRNDMPTLISITSIKYFDDGTSRTHIYPDCTIEGISTSAQRSQNVTTRLPWRCGTGRI